VITPDTTVFNAAAPETTLRLLTYALVAGATVLFPSLFFLFRVFKGNEKMMLTVLRRRIAVY
jgi:cytochrome bd ubiquinol oxidase subunit II